MRRREGARRELPSVADLDVLVIVKAGPDPFHVLLEVAQFDVAPATGAPAALEIDHVVMDIRARRYLPRGDSAVKLEQGAATRRPMFALAPLGDRLSVGVQ